MLFHSRFLISSVWRCCRLPHTLYNSCFYVYETLVWVLESLVNNLLLLSSLTAHERTTPSCSPRIKVLRPGCLLQNILLFLLCATKGRCHVTLQTNQSWRCCKNNRTSVALIGLSAFSFSFFEDDQWQLLTAWFTEHAQKAAVGAEVENHPNV